MNKKVFSYSSVITLFVISCVVAACGEAKKPPEKEIVVSPEELHTKVTELIRSSIDYAVANDGRIDDSIKLELLAPLKQVYESTQFATSWNAGQQWQPVSDSMLELVRSAQFYGLFPEDYHSATLEAIYTKLVADTSDKTDKKDAVLWAKADLLLTDAFMHMVKDVKLGRLPQDSVSLRKDSVLVDEFYIQKLQSLLKQQESLASIIASLEPQHAGYKALKAGAKAFLDSADYQKVYTRVPSPKDPGFTAALEARMREGGYLTDSLPPDSLQMASAIKKFQLHTGITDDGKAGEGTVRMLNFTDKDRFVSLAINMDRYKMLPEQMPERYIWVNLPGFYMKLLNKDSLEITSKVICGKPITRTPLLNSSISNLVTYPQWTIPNSIIVKEILPALKKNTGYLAKKGYSLINSRGDEVSADSVDWSKYSKGIPFNVVQGSGDENALGILKFNFPNKYAVYLHDTNQRYLFARTGRALSHGCVRVQQWEELAYNIVRYDNDSDQYIDTPSPKEDSMSAWLQRKEKHSIGVKNRLPVFIRYFTADAKDGKVVFYDDIYGEDKYVRAKYFAGK
ncbi:L,D-transpeptidase family protein [Terrimonas sp. NA20]|uniref:L,D-transpeptidase family protein n=1 Tax=Terrimonas ginsenosidimutans TaxID=2908004 RepID=A0ABS9KTC6_9BACT|nr:L,D-transpeptidase family protein [Terrimonas ginsenosidimutans]MCG2615578.1 L,D-transpeptidase family protein [Terrimonas ginsenosidimutans]